MAAIFSREPARDRGGVASGVALPTEAQVRQPARTAARVAKQSHERLTREGGGQHMLCGPQVNTPLPIETVRTSRVQDLDVTHAPTPGSKSAVARPAVLWVDDDEGLNRYATRLLSSAGFDVTVASESDRALSELTTSRHGVVVLDQRLPPQPDLQVLKKIRRAGNTVPVVVLTGFGTPASAVEALQLGVIDYQQKPVQSDRILAAVRIGLRIGQCHPIEKIPQARLRSGASLALLSVYVNLQHADEHQLATQLAWAVADDAEDLGFVELVGSVQALRELLADRPQFDATMRRRVRACLTRAVETAPTSLSRVAKDFIRLITKEGAGVRGLTDDGVADRVGVSVAQLSRAVHYELSASPGDCKFIAEMRPALQQLADTREQVAQIGYQLGYAHHSAFDRDFRKLIGTSPTGYRALLIGLTS